MYKDHRIVCIIPARGGSKGLPGKNIRDFFGRPLISHTICQALISKYIDRTLVSTDSKRIAGIAKTAGAEVPFIRPKRLATDRCGTIDALLHAVDWMEHKAKYDFDIVVLLHANTPLRITKDIDNCIIQLVKEKAENVFSVTASHRNPYFNMAELKEGWAVQAKKGNFASRQVAPAVFDLNSSIYVWWKDVLKDKKRVFLRKSSIYVMPKERSIDIDDIFDWKIAELFYREGR